MKKSDDGNKESSFSQLQITSPYEKAHSSYQNLHSRSNAEDRKADKPSFIHTLEKTFTFNYGI